MINLDGPPLCPECGPTDRIPNDDGSRYCVHCGYVFDAVDRTARDQAPHHSAEIERLRARLADYEADSGRVLSEQCALDEKHCACVPVLRARVAELEARPTVHPLAWAYLVQKKTGAGNLKRVWDDWSNAGRTLTATGGEVLAPEVEP